MNVTTWEELEAALSVTDADIDITLIGMVPVHANILLTTTHDVSIIGATMNSGLDYTPMILDPNSTDYNTITHGIQIDTTGEVSIQDLTLANWSAQGIGLAVYNASQLTMRGILLKDMASLWYRRAEYGQSDSGPYGSDTLYHVYACPVGIGGGIFVGEPTGLPQQVTIAECVVMRCNTERRGRVATFEISAMQLTFAYNFSTASGRLWSFSPGSGGPGGSFTNNTIVANTRCAIDRILNEGESQIYTGLPGGERYSSGYDQTRTCVTANNVHIGWKNFVYIASECWYNPDNPGFPLGPKTNFSYHDNDYSRLKYYGNNDGREFAFTRSGGPSSGQSLSYDDDEPAWRTIPLDADSAAGTLQFPTDPYVTPAPPGIYPNT